MSNSELPERASLEYLKKLAKDRLRQLRRGQPQAKLAVALLAVAREHGFPSWRALKAEVARRQAAHAHRFFEACAQGDVMTLSSLLAADPGLVHARDAHGATGLHAAAHRGWLDAARLLLEHGADPNARDQGDNAYPLHFAAGLGHVEVACALLDAGGDVHGFGDLHEVDVIGWATALGAPDRIRWDVLPLLIERGARHHIFSAIAVGDLALIEKLVEHDDAVLERRMSRFEQKRTPLHFAIGLKRYDILDLLIGLGADLEACDGNGKTALETAMLLGDRHAMRRLAAAGASQPASIGGAEFRASAARLAESIRKGVPAIRVADVAASLAWYASIGFREIARYGEDGTLNFGLVAFGRAELMFNVGGKKGQQDVSLWFYTDRIDDLYKLFKARQVGAAQAALAGEAAAHEAILFEEDIYDPFYGGRQFSIRDPDGYTLLFLQPANG
jgi:ankyrin repeat protein/catechol 2,3-dioxygenase-like lactoylglutathione lyase family enzyme